MNQHSPMESVLSDSHEFFKSILDTITEHVVVINSNGDIIFANQSWINFGLNNNCLLNGSWDSINYLKVCDESVAMGDELASKAAEGIRKVINKEHAKFYLEYPCHSLHEQRWFMMWVTTFQVEKTDYYVISHQNITERKLAEEKALDSSRSDCLIGIPNRRCFNEFLSKEWKRCARLNTPITLAFIDIDHFKELNDTYGHQAGDECLQRIGRILKEYGKRPSDICARWGGEEFVLLFGNTTLDTALGIMNKFNNAIRALKIPNRNSPISPTVSVSIGVASMSPKDKPTESILIKYADNLLYIAKRNGKNQIASKTY